MSQPEPFEYLEGDTFSFACHPGLPCFTECCRDLKLVLTPYDILRLKNRLGLTSSQFLDQYTVGKPGELNGYPAVLLKMEDNERRTCPFVSPSGCRIYEDRPGACRIYPIGRATSQTQGQQTKREFFFVVREEHCRGFWEPKTWTIAEWSGDQGLQAYNRFNDAWMEIITRKASREAEDPHSKKMQMFFMAAYNLDRFRKFVLESTFLDRFNIPEERGRKIRSDDDELLLLAFQWLGFSLYGDKVLTVKH
ncbi:MAG: YkgJ family cysteine cluster protein [Thermodesulfobacteriota bacterium]